MTNSLKVLSLGWGVQSWTIAAMIARGFLPPVDFMVHADTTWEHEATYEFAEKWTPWLGENGQNIVTVKSDRVDVIQKWESETEGIMAPVFTLSPEGDEGQLGRQCTATWKIYPIRRFVAEQLADRGLKKTPGVVTMIQGISLDEFWRMRDSDVKYVVHEYPLVDRRLTRSDCMAWLKENGLPVPRKSSCVFCPYKSMAQWKDLGRKQGVDLETAVMIDSAVRNKREKFKLFVHPSRKPLGVAVQDDGQLELWPEASCDSGYCFT